MFLRWLRGTSLVLAVCFLSAACAPAMNQGGMETQTDGHEPNRITYRFQRGSYHYFQDNHEFGLRNANPNLAVGQWRNPSDPPESVEQRRIRQSAMTIDGVQDADVQILGGHVAVKILPQPGYPEARYEELQEKVLRRISYELPRYEVRVRVGWSKWNPLSHFPPFRNHAG